MRISDWSSDVCSSDLGTVSKLVLANQSILRMKKSVFIEIVSALLILLFIYAAISKIIDHQTFLVQLGRSPLLTRFAPLLVWTVPIIELLLAILLAIRFTRMLALHGAFFLMILFTVYLIAMFI